MESLPFGDVSVETVFASESFHCFLESASVGAAPKQKRAQSHGLCTCPHVRPREAVVTNHRASPLMLCDSGLGGWVWPSALVPHCPSLPPLLKPFDSRSGRNILLLTGFVPFVLHIPPTARPSVQPIHRPLKWVLFLALVLSEALIT